MRKQGRIDIGFVRDSFIPEGRSLQRKASGENTAAPLTKNLKDISTFQKHRRNMGIVDGADFEKIVGRPLTFFTRKQ